MLIQNITRSFFSSILAIKFSDTVNFVIGCLLRLFIVFCLDTICFIIVIDELTDLKPGTRCVVY